MCASCHQASVAGALDSPHLPRLWLVARFAVVTAVSHRLNDTPFVADLCVRDCTGKAAARPRARATLLDALRQTPRLNP